MALSIAKGTFAANTSTGDQVISGLSFQPKAVFLWLSRVTAEGYGVNFEMSFGWGTSSTQRLCVPIGGDDAATNVAHGLHTDAIITNYSSAATPTIGGVADLVTLNSDGFTINWSNAPAGALIVHYECWGGSDITNAKAGTFTLATTGASQAVTDPGFQPDLLLLMDCSVVATGDTTNSTQFSIGAATGTSNQAFTSISDARGIGTARTGEYQRSDSIDAIISAAATPTESWRFTLGSLDPTGFTINWASANPGAAVIIPYLAFKGGQYKVGVETQATSATTKATTGLGFRPSGLLLFGGNNAASTSVRNASAKLTVGGGDGTNAGCTWFSSTDAANPNDRNNRSVTSKVFTHSTNASTTDAEADLQSLDSDGFTLNWTTADATAREFVYVAAGSNPVTAVPLAWTTA